MLGKGCSMGGDRKEEGRRGKEGKKGGGGERLGVKGAEEAWLSPLRPSRPQKIIIITILGSFYFLLAVEIIA